MIISWRRSWPVRSAITSAGLICLVAPAPVLCRADESPSDSSQQQSIDSAVAAVKPALVRLHVVTVDYSQGREAKSESTGSGVIIDKDGHVITNHHVAGDAKQILCTLSSKEEIEADLVGTDAMSDISVIKLRAAKGRQFPWANFGDSSALRVGQQVLAMGSPMALSQSVTRGIVSNTEMIMPDVFWPYSLTMDGEDVGSIVRWIGHDAQIFPGNSGGPLVNMQGQIVGINEINLGLSGAIPSALAKPVAQELIAKGKVARSWIGVEIQPLLKSLKADKGALVSGAVEGSPAAKAGFRTGDILIRLDGQDVVAQYAEQLPLLNQIVASLPIGKEVEAVVLRDGKETPLRVTTQEREKVEARPTELKEWGICASDISSFQAREMKLKSRDGVLVWSVRAGGSANEAKPPIEDNDVILQVDGKPVARAADLVTLTKQITQGKTEPVPALVCFQRDNERYLTVVRVGVQDIEDPGLEARKAWLPVATQVITEELATALGVPGTTGVRVTQVYPGSAAQDADLRVGDLIVGLDGEQIPASQPEDTEVLPSMIRKYKIGSKATVDIVRGNEKLKIEVTLPQAQKLAREMKKYRDDNFEFTCREIAFLDRTRNEWTAGQQGVLVEEVSEGGWAALGHLAVGDLVISVGGEPVTNLMSLRSLMKKTATEKPKELTLQVLRGIHTMYVELQTAWDTPADQTTKNNDKN